MICEDFIMLGKTVPEPNSDGRTFVCSAGWSKEMRSLIRIYPLAMQDAPSMWTMASVRLERNPQDHRTESWRLRGDRSGDHHRTINSVFTVQKSLTGTEIASVMEQIEAQSKKQANDAKQSLAVIQPDFPPELHFSENVESDDHPQLSLFARTDEEKRKAGAATFPFQPRLRFSCNGDFHDLQLRDWGCYEWMRKNEMDGRATHPIRKRLLDNPRLLVGNMNRHRNCWLVISVLRPVHQLDLFALAAE